MSRLLTTKPNYFKWTSAEWRTYYYDTLRTVTDTYADGTKVTFNARTLNLPALIVNTWLRTLFSNNLTGVEVGLDNDKDKVDYIVDNKILVGERDGLPMYFDIKSIVESTLAYGSILVDYNEGQDGELLPVLINNYKKIVDKTGQPIGFTYKRKVKGRFIKVSHVKINQQLDENGEEVTKGRYAKMVDGEEIWNNPDYMLAHESENILKLDDGSTLPIYAYALSSIEECNDAFNELATDRVLSRKMVLIPRIMESSNRSRLKDDQTQVPIIDKNNRLFRVYDTQDEKNTPTFIDGSFDPIPHIEECNFYLKFVGVHSGHGAKRFSMDNNGSIKTAEEVQSDNYEYIISEANIIDEVIGTLVSNILTRVFERPILIDVSGSKDELEKVEDRDKRLLQEYMAGLITIKDYHTLRGVTEDEYKLLEVSNNIPDKYAEQIKKEEKINE